MKKVANQNAIVAARPDRKKKQLSTAFPDIPSDIPPEKRREFIRRERILQANPNRIASLLREKESLLKEIERIDSDISRMQAELEEVK